MPLSTDANLEGIRQFTRQIWESVLQLPLDDAPGVQLEADGQSMSASVQITGAWEGSIRVSCRQSFARRAASIMFELADSELTDAEIKDTLGELTNMVAGQLKALVPEPSVLSIPCLECGGSADNATGQPLARLGFECAGEAIEVLVSDAATSNRQAA